MKQWFKQFFCHHYYIEYKAERDGLHRILFYLRCKDCGKEKIISNLRDV